MRPDATFVNYKCVCVYRVYIYICKHVCMYVCIGYIYIYIYIYILWGGRGGVVVKALRYKLAGRGFDSR